MTAPAYRASSAVTAAGNSAASVAVTIPSAVVAGDLMIAVIGFGAAPGTATTPSGWSRLPRMSGLTGSTAHAFYKIAAAADTGGAVSVSFTHTNAVDTSLSFAAWSGVHQTTPFGSAKNGGGTDDFAIPNGFPPVADCLLVFIHGGDSTADESAYTFTGGATANWTRRAGHSNANSRPFSAIWDDTTDGASANRTGLGTTTTTNLNASAVSVAATLTLVPATQTTPFIAGSLSGKTAGGGAATTITIAETSTGDKPSCAAVPGMYLLTLVNMMSESTTATLQFSNNGYSVASLDSSTPHDMSGTDTLSTEVFGKFLTEAECWNGNTSETLTTTISSAVEQSGIGLWIGGVDPTTPIQSNVDGEQTSNSSTPDNPNAACDDFGVVVLFACAASGSTTTPTVPSGYTLGPNVYNASNFVAKSMLAYKVLGDAPTTPENPAAWAAVESDQWKMRTVALFNVPASTLTVTPDASLVAGTATVAYAGDTIVATGGHEDSSGLYTFSISAGALPTGLSISATTGAITGTPTVAGSFNFTVQAADLAAITDTEAFTIEITALPSGGLGGWMAAVMD
jgi:hypothetical protein